MNSQYIFEVPYNTFENEHQKIVHMNGFGKFIDDAVQYSTKDSGKGGKRNYAILENIGCRANKIQS